MLTAPMHIRCLIFKKYFTDVLVNGVAESIDFTAYPEGKPYTMVIIQRITEADSTYTYQMLFAAGFTINVYPISGLLSLSVAITGEWYNQLTGMDIVLNFYTAMEPDIQHFSSIFELWHVISNNVAF